MFFLPPGLAGLKKFRSTFKSQRNGTAHLATMTVSEKWVKFGNMN